MGDKIALGFHACVDFELKWDQEKLERLIEHYQIKDEELTTGMYIDSERQLLLTLLGHMKVGMGAEFVPETPEICFDFSQHFDYKVTIGGTAARAATAISKLGYESALSMVCYNQYIKNGLPDKVHYYSNVGENHGDIYPHVVLSYPGNVHVRAAGVDFVTPRENRVMFSRDIDSLNMVISQGFAERLTDVEVMLLGCFSEVLDEEVLHDRMDAVNSLLESLPESAMVVFEDGCYIRKDFRTYVHEVLREKMDILSMNEDEMQEYIDRRIDIMDPKEILSALQYIYERIRVPLLIVHSAAWAIAYGKNAKNAGHVLEGGIASASARFIYGDDFDMDDYAKVKARAVREDSVAFAAALQELSDREICCVPSKDMSGVKNPVIVGLGDSFAGGMLPELTLDKRGYAK